jgi:oligopeptide/dipeptide ABC transporter ATP-binding protein
MMLEVSGLRVELGPLALVDDFTFTLDEGQVHAVVGESGSGKTLSALALLSLLPEGATSAGTIRLDGVTPTNRKGFAMVLQEPLSALNPVLSIGAQLLETLEVHGTKGELRSAALELLREVGIDDGASRLSAYPHQLSGGQRQRVAIACALAASPRALIADEPTTALDASMRGVILSILRRLAKERSMGVWLITHDLHSVREASDLVTVMYAGRVVEQGATARVLSAPRHPYTAALLASNPSATAVGTRLPSIPGAVPLASERISGCRFHPRCPKVFGPCSLERPALLDGVACHAVERAQ